MPLSDRLLVLWVLSMPLCEGFRLLLADEGSPPIWMLTLGTDLWKNPLARFRLIGPPDMLALRPLAMTAIAGHKHHGVMLLIFPWNHRALLASIGPYACGGMVAYDGGLDLCLPSSWTMNR